MRSVEAGVPAKMATQNPPELETDDSEQEEGDGYGSGGGLNPEIKPSGAGVSGPPLLCLIRFASDSAAGALMGSVFGYGLSFFVSLRLLHQFFVPTALFIHLQPVPWNS